MNKHWPSELVSFMELLSQLHSQHNLFTTQPPLQLPAPQQGLSYSTWERLTLSAESKEKKEGGREGGREGGGEGGRESPIKGLRQDGG